METRKSYHCENESEEKDERYGYENLWIIWQLFNCSKWYSHTSGPDFINSYVATLKAAQNLI